MLWKLEGSAPVYLQIMEQIRRAVLTGEFLPGARIPPVRELAAAAKVNPNTMQRALTALEQEKLLVTFGTAGRYVTNDRQVLDRMRQTVVEALVASSAREFQALGLTVEQAAAMLLAYEKEA